MSVFQLLLICIYLAIFTYESRSSLSLTIYPGNAVVGGFITGLICHNVRLGLLIGATCQLASLGVFEVGGVSMPDYHVGAVVATMVCTMNGNTDLDYALPIAITVATLMVQLDVLARMLIAFFINRSRSHAEKLEINQAYIWNCFGIVPYMLRHILPVVIVYFAGAKAIDAVLSALPKAVMGAFSATCKILPAMGVAILLRYLAVKENIAYLLVGFVLVAYLKLPVLGLAIVGTALALLYLMRNNGFGNTPVNVGGNDDDEL